MPLPQDQFIGPVGGRHQRLRRYLNPPGRALVGAGALTAAVFSHSCCNNDAFRDVQQEVIIEDQEEVEEF